MSYINAEFDKGIVKVWERDANGRHLVKHKAPFYFYVEDDRGEHTSLFGDKCSRLDFDGYDEYLYAKKQFEGSRAKLFESDILPLNRVLAEHYYEVDAPDLQVTFWDIEVDYDKEIGFSSVDNPYAPVNAVALHNQWENKSMLFAVPPKSWGSEDTWDGQLADDVKKMADVRLFNTERELLLAFIDNIQESDVLCGWNSDFFDTPYTARRIEMVLGKSYLNKLSFDNARPPRYKEVEAFGKPQTMIDLGGRISADYLQLFKKFEMSNRPSFALAAVSTDVLPELPKLEYDGNLADLYNNDFNHFLRYNNRDTECLLGFEQKLGYVALANDFYHLSTGLFNNVAGTIKLAELALVNYCHKVLNVVAPNIPRANVLEGKAEGALVLQPKQGMQKLIGSMDINSLYPSAIRAINISPETLVGQFSGTVTDFESIVSDSDKPISLRFEDNTLMTKSAKEWKEFLKSHGFAVSGYGTVFNQHKAGIIPSILSDWYDTRKMYQRENHTAKNNGDMDKAAYYDRLQYCYKIKLNSLYGALLNQHFRFYDPRMGESTTGTGRAILRFMCARVNQLLTGEFDVYGEAVVYGDTDSVYFKTFGENEQQAILIADHVADKTNKSFPAFMQETFLCGDEYKDIIKAGREIVASAGIFVTPKKYILHVVDNEGDSCDKLKVMGLDTKKTTLPKIYQDKLNSFIERYLKGEDWDAVARDIVDFKDELLLIEDVTLLGLPKGVNGVEDYTQQVETIGEHVRVPGHVRASIYYNKMLDLYEDKESFKIQSNMKIRIYYLQEPDGKFSSIALPTDLTHTPDWFLSHIKVNRKKQITRLVDNPLENILKAVDKVSPSRQSILVGELLSF